MALGGTVPTVRGAGQPAGCALGFGTYGLPGYPLADAVRLVATTGFSSVEIVSIPGYHGAPDQVSTAQRREVRRLIADSGLQLGALMGLPFPDRAKRAANIEWMKRLLELAIDLRGAEPPLIQGVLGGGKWEERKALFRDCLGPWVALADDAGVRLAVKPHRGHAMSRPKEATWLIEQLNAKGKLRLVYDYSHYAFRDPAVAGTVEAALPHVGYLVMKDAVRQGEKVRFALPGATGEMPHARILKQFHDDGYRGEVCCEVSSQVWRAAGYDPRAGLQTCFRNMAQIFRAAGVGIRRA